MTAPTILHGVETQEQPLVPPIAVNNMAVGGLIGTADGADPDVFPYDTPVLLSSNPQLAASLIKNAPGSGLTAGTLPSAVNDFYNEGGGALVVVRVSNNVSAETVMSSIVGSSSTMTGSWAFKQAQALLGVKPRTLWAPGYTATRPGAAANPVVAALLIIATALRGRVYASTPSTDESDAQAWIEDWQSDRLTAFFPSVLTWDVGSAAYVARDAASVNAGLTARVHAKQGFWWSPSNWAYNSVGGLAVPVDWAQGDYGSMANILNSNNITTVINQAAQGGNVGGFVRWGNRVPNTSTIFECVRTTMDTIEEAIQNVCAWANDKPPSPFILEQLAYQANGFLKSMVTAGALVGADFWIDPNDNPVNNLEQGTWTFRFDAEPPAPMEHIINIAQRNPNYYNNLLSAVIAAVGSNTTGG